MEFHLFFRKSILGYTISFSRKSRTVKEEFLLACSPNISLGYQLSNRDIELVKFLSYLRIRNQDMENNLSILSMISL